MDVGGLLLSAFQIGGGRSQEARIVVEPAKSGIAFVTQETAHLAGLVAVIDAKHPVGCPLADCASAILERQQLLVFL